MHNLPVVLEYSHTLSFALLAFIILYIWKPIQVQLFSLCSVYKISALNGVYQPLTFFGAMEQNNQNYFTPSVHYSYDMLVAPLGV